MTATPNYDTERCKRLSEEEWTDPAVVSSWDKWHRHFAHFSRGFTEEMLRVGDVKTGMQVLDLASGTGEPAITLARIVAPDGQVTATDVGRDILAIAERNASEGSVTNMTFQQADVHELPFNDNSFDLVTCRAGVMYFGDYPKALREARRVLTPGGRAVWVAIGRFEQPIFECTVGVLMKHVEMPPPDPDAPDAFRFAKEGTLASALTEAGFRDVREEAPSPLTTWPGSAEELWQWFTEIAPTFRPLIDQLPKERQAAVFGEIHQALNKYSDGEKITMPYQIVVAVASK